MSERSAYPYLFDSKFPYEPILSKLSEAADKVEKQKLYFVQISNIEEILMLFVPFIAKSSFIR